MARTQALKGEKNSDYFFPNMLCCHHFKIQEVIVVQFFFFLLQMAGNCVLASEQLSEYGHLSVIL